MLLIAFTFAWSKSYSAFLMICLALTVFKGWFKLNADWSKIFMETSKGEDSVIFIIWSPELQPFPISKTSAAPLSHTLVVKFDVDFSYC